jgi:putative transposase
MSIRKTSFSINEFYHIYNRGNDKREIFLDEQDYNYFIKLLYVANSNDNFNLANLNRYKDFNVFTQKNNNIVSIGAYVLMPNHFHILIAEIEDGGISRFMQKLGTAFVMYFNKKYKRTGSLFEGKFKSQHLNTDIYLKYIFSYIHLNPVKLIDKNWKESGLQSVSKTFDFLNQYQYSSYIDYIRPLHRKELAILTKDSFPDYFPSPKLMNKEITDWLKYKDSQY